MVQQLEDAVIRVTIDPRQAREELARVEEEREKIRGEAPRKKHAEEREEERERKEGLVKTLVHEARGLGANVQAGYMLGAAGKAGGALMAIRAAASPAGRTALAAGVGIGSAALFLESLPLFRPLINEGLDRFFATDFLGKGGPFAAAFAKWLTEKVENLMNAQVGGWETIRENFAQISDLWEGVKGVSEYIRATALLGGDLSVDQVKQVFTQDTKWAEMMRQMARYGDKARQVLFGEFIKNQVFRIGYH